MITNLEEFYKNIQNPILEEENFNTLIHTYSKHNFLDSEYKGDIKSVYSKGNGTFSPSDLNTFYAKVFNYWKKYLTISKIPNTSSLYSLQQYFKNVKDVSTWRDAVDAFPIKRKNEYLNKLLDISGGSQQISSVNIHEKDESMSSLPFNVEHILYVNVDLEYLHKFATKFLDKCEEKHIPYLFNINTDWRCDDSFTISSDSKHLLNYYQILLEITKENKDLKEHIYHPPVFSGIVDGFIGYESADMVKNRENQQVSHLILSKSFKKMISNQPQLPLNQDEEPITLVDLISSNIVSDKIDYLSNLDRKQLMDYFGLKPRDLKSRKFLNLMFSTVKEELLSGISDKSFNFNDIEISYRKRKNKSITISHEDLERSLSSSFKNITDKYPKTKKMIQHAILNTAKKVGIDGDKFCLKKENKDIFSSIFQEKKKTTLSGNNQYDFQKYINQARLVDTIISEQNVNQARLVDTIISEQDVDARGDDFSIYHLTKEQIIQDLPIYSKEESRFQGVMSEQEIEISREKIKTYCKK